MGPADCVVAEGSLSCEDVRTIIEPYFRVVQAEFVAFECDRWGDSRVAKTRLKCSEEAHDTPRHFAGCLDDGSMIVVAPNAVDLPERTLLGILAHEFGHALDFCRPAELAVDPLAFEARVRRLPTSPKKERVLANRYRQWSARDDDAVERHADAIAELVTGASIGYAGPCSLQTLGQHAKRPLGLR